MTKSQIAEAIASLDGIIDLVQVAAARAERQAPGSERAEHLWWSDQHLRDARLRLREASSEPKGGRK